MCGTETKPKAFDPVSVASQQSQIRTKKKVAWFEFIRPEASYFDAYDTEIDLLAFQHLCKLAFADPERDDVFAALSNLSCIHHYSVDGFTGKDWKVDLWKRFQGIFLSNFKRSARDFYAQRGVALYGTSIVPIRYYDGYNWLAFKDWHTTGDWRNDGMSGLKNRLTLLLTMGGQTLTESYNEFHPKAKCLHGVSLICRRDGWRVRMSYCYPEDFGKGTASRWSLDTDQEPGEMLFDFLRRADWIVRSRCEPVREEAPVG